MTNTTPTASPAVPRTIAAVEADLDKIFALIAAAHRLMEDGRLVDLGALNSHVHGACKAALDLPNPEARQLTGKLGILLDQLDGLEIALQNRFGDLPIMPSHSVSTAAAAYADILKHFP